MKTVNVKNWSGRVWHQWVNESIWSTVHSSTCVNKYRCQRGKQILSNHLHKTQWVCSFNSFGAQWSKFCSFTDMRNMESIYYKDKCFSFKSLTSKNKFHKLRNGNMSCTSSTSKCCRLSLHVLLTSNSGRSRISRWGADWEGADLRHRYFSVETCVKMQELGPVGRAPLDPPKSKNKSMQQET